MSRAAVKKVKTTDKKHALPQIGAQYSVEYGSVEHIIDVLNALDAVYKSSDMPADEYATGEPLDGLILTVLSQNTNDRNRDKAYDALRNFCPSWSDVASLDPDKLASLIKPAGLGDTKSVRILQILDRINKDMGNYSLKKLFDERPSNVRDYLLSFDGVGPKTVGCVMIFDLGMTAFPVDTHIARISRRLGWAREKDSPVAIQDHLEQMVPPELAMSGHLNMIMHGRAVCCASKQKCTECCTAHMCRSWRVDTPNIEG